MKASIFQIALDKPARSRCDSGFAALDDMDDGDAEWGEYGAIRHFFRNQPTNDDELYGFVASDFRAKTGLSADQVHAFVRDHPGHEVYTFAPAARDGACYMNVFEQGDAAQPGLAELAALCLKQIGLDVELGEHVMDVRSMVDGHFIVARRSFWQLWFPLTEKLHDILEHPDAQMGALFDGLLKHHASSGIKQALVERIGALVLALCPDIAACTYDPTAMPWSDPRQRPYEKQLAALNANKSSYVRSGNRVFLQNFYTLRDSIGKVGWGGRPGEPGQAAASSVPGRLNATDELMFVCFSHVPLPFEYPPFVSPLYLGEAQGAGKFNLRDLAPEWEPYHPQLGSLAGCFAMKNYIVRHGLSLRRIGMCQYRKFVSATRIGGMPAPNYPVMDVIGKPTLDEYNLAEVMLPGNDDFLIGQYGFLEEGYLGQYNKAHLAEDLLRFVSEAVELGVLGRNEVVPFFSSTLFMAGGIEVGVFPAPFWVEAITAIEHVVRACTQRYPARRYGYQARSWAFCAERLGSFLLLKYIKAKFGEYDKGSKFLGQLNVYSTDGSGQYVPNGAQSAVSA
ncbi:MAG TPA: hypothetical protein VGL08_18890 [Paraburkholderia sp.]|jgi:hypothetical protein